MTNQKATHQGEAEMLKREIAEDERKGWVDKRTSQRTRMEQLDAQMREKVPRHPRDREPRTSKLGSQGS